MNNNHKYKHTSITKRSIICLDLMVYKVNITRYLQLHYDMVSDII